MIDFKPYIREIDDFPIPGISFKDISTLLQNGKAYREAIQELLRHVDDLDIDLIAGPEARGFIVGAPLAVSMGVGFIPIRKPGKLPGETVEVTYDLEYGQDKLTIHKDAISAGQRVLLVDDLLATGGTLESVKKLVEKLGGEVVGAAFLIELTDLNGREKLGNIPITSLVSY